MTEPEGKGWGTLWAANPSETGDYWFVWNMREPLPSKPVFYGSMEDAGLVADALNAALEQTKTGMCMFTGAKETSAAP
jgi:hypothetical protein